MTTANTKPSRRPQIILGATEADSLAGLALGMEDRFPDVAGMLLDEIERAKVLPDHKVPHDVITMQSQVRYRDETTGTERVVSLVYPQMADIQSGKVSILTPVGAGLIGLRTGQSIRWKDRGAQERIFHILDVVRIEEGVACE